MSMDMLSVVGWPIIRLEAEGRKYGTAGIEVLRIHYTDRERTPLGYGKCNAECCQNRGSGDITIHLSDLPDEGHATLVRDLVNAAERMGGEGNPIREAYNALKVVVENAPIREWMEANDPQAMRQIRKATVGLEKAGQHLNPPF